jgi:hypothetical protein
LGVHCGGCNGGAVGLVDGDGSGGIFGADLSAGMLGHVEVGFIQCDIRIENREKDTWTYWY